MLRGTALALMFALPAAAEVPLPDDPATAAFVAANLIATFYHEVGHALIDTVDLTFAEGEEDAADTISVLLIDRLWPEDQSAALIVNVAKAYLLFDARSSAEGGAQPYRTAHSLDLQRYYTFVCLYYGADPEAREELADDLDLPAERRESCPEEFQMANDSWGAMLDEMPPQDYGPRLRLVVPAGRDALTALMADAVRRMNAAYGLTVPVDVTVETCGEANAFYDMRARRIVICVEYADDLAKLFSEADK